MKVLIIQSDGEHKGQDSYCRNDYLRECWAIKHAFVQNEIEDVTVWGKRHGNFKDKIDFNNFDLIFVIEQYDTEWIPDLSKYKKPKKLHWVIDLHCLGAKPYKEISESCDIILHSTRSLMYKYKEVVFNKKHIWFPNGVDDRYFYAEKYDTEDYLDQDSKSKKDPYKRDNNIVFVGSDLKERKDWITFAQKNIGLETMFKTGEEMIDTILKSRIHFNKSINEDCNYRNFETIGLGTCLLTNYLSELEDLGFKDGQNCFLYKNKKEIVEKYEWAMKNENYYYISLMGYLLSKDHTYTKRIQSLIEDRII